MMLDLDWVLEHLVALGRKYSVVSITFKLFIGSKLFFSKGRYAFSFPFRLSFSLPLLSFTFILSFSLSFLFSFPFKSSSF